MNKSIYTILFAFIAIVSCKDSKKTDNTSLEKPSAEPYKLQQIMYYGGDILTMKGNEPNYTEAIVVREGHIVFTGSKKDADTRFKGKATEYDLQGKTMLPGFLDAHSHYINSLLVANQCQLYAPPSGPGKDIPSIINTLKEFVKDKNIPKGELIMGYGYDDTVMPNGILLNRDDLDEFFPDNPVRIEHVSMHGCVLNSLAMKMYGISKETKTPPGGVIVRKPGTQEPYGLIMETAFLPIMEQSSPMTLEQEVAWSKQGQMLYAQEGITTAHEGASHLAQIETIKRASEEGANIIDIVAYPFITDVDKVLKVIPRDKWLKYDNNFKIGGVKITIDGSPQGRTAYFTTPYLKGGPAGEKNWTGEMTFPQEMANEMVKKVYGMNVPLILHCNGDAAIDAFFKAYEFARDGDYSKPWNVTTIHSQFMRKDQMPKFIKYNVRPSFYTLHTYYFYEAHLENRGFEQAQYISPIRDAIDMGMKPTNHTDFVVAPLDQMMMLWSAVNRMSRAGAKVGHSQKITPYEGLKAMTIYVAEQYDEAGLKGTLEKGKIADLVILDKNPLKVNEANIKDINIIETIKKGKSIYKKQ
jgi:predicted amidohydrolase YtcJ